MKSYRHTNYFRLPLISCSSFGSMEFFKLVPFVAPFSVFLVYFHYTQCCRGFPRAGILLLRMWVFFLNRPLNTLLYRKASLKILINRFCDLYIRCKFVSHITYEYGIKVSFFEKYQTFFFFIAVESVLESLSSKISTVSEIVSMIGYHEFVV
jgi:hypothetical protein